MHTEISAPAPVRPDDSPPPTPGALDVLKAEDEHLYALMMRDHLVLARDLEARRAVVGAANSFVRRLESTARELETVSLDDYNWLTETATRWEVIYASMFNLPKDIVINVPPERLKRPEPARVFAADDLQRWIGDRAHELSRIRKIRSLLREVDALHNRMPSSGEEMREDWHSAQVELCSQMLAGLLHFATRFVADSYPQLEEVWLHEVKQHRAFITWEERGCPWSLDAGLDDYNLACRRLGEALAGSPFKSLESGQFSEARAYLDLQYLTGGKLDLRKPAARAMVERKAWEAHARTASDDSTRNWGVAEGYARRFYEHIIPAALERSAPSTRQVLTALHDSESPHSGLGIANAFEAALAIYFLDPETIRASGVEPWL